MARTSPTKGTERAATLISALQKAPASSHLDFPHYIRHLLRPPFDRQIANLVLDDPELSYGIRFAAFYMLLVDCWRDRDYGQFRSYLDQYESIFSKEPLTEAMVAEYYSSLPDDAGLAIAIEHARTAISLSRNQPNVQHLYAELIAKSLESSVSDQKSNIVEAERELNLAIATTGGKYAKYYSTLARLLALRGKYQEAKQAIHVAIEREDSADPHYALRIGDYHNIRSQIFFREQLAKLRSEHSNAVQELNDVRLRVIEMLGLLAAVIAFLISGSQISQNVTYPEAVRLMLTVSGSILVVFAGYSMIFSLTRLRLVQIVMLLVGLGIALAPLLVPSTWLTSEGQRAASR